MATTISEVTIDGVKMYKDGEMLREPRFLMPEKEGYQNEKARVVKRIGHKQLLLELYIFDERRTFFFVRLDKAEETIMVIEKIMEKMMKDFQLTITDILPTEFQEYKANFSEFRWIKPK